MQLTSPFHGAAHLMAISHVVPVCHFLVRGRLGHQSGGPFENGCTDWEPSPTVGDWLIGTSSTGSRKTVTAVCLAKGAGR